MKLTLITDKQVAECNTKYQVRSAQRDKDQAAVDKVIDQIKQKRDELITQTLKRKSVIREYNYTHEDLLDSKIDAMDELLKEFGKETE